MANIWTVTNNYNLGTLVERVKLESGDLPLPVTEGSTVELISGKLPNGLRLEGTEILGTPLEVILDTQFRFVLRANLNGAIEDRTFVTTVTGPDEPIWLTNEGLLSVSDTENLFVLDNEIIDYQLLAIDPDTSAGDVLEFYISSGDGILPPGLELTPDGRITGVVEPLLALDKIAKNGGYDTAPFDAYPQDFAIRSDNGFDSYFYDTVTFDFFTESQSPKKLNRFYRFRISVSDGKSEPVATRVFQIYVVGDDYLRSDNTIMKVGNGIFKADNTHVRTPKFLTPREIGYKRADNNITLYLEVLDSNTLIGKVLYSLEETNDDGTPSVLPPGCGLDPLNGEITGYVPYQPAVTTDYNFTVRATRYTADTDFAYITATVYEDTLAGKRSFKVYKLPRNVEDGILLEDGIDDLNDLRGETIELFGRQYKVESVEGSDEDFDVLTLETPLAAQAEIEVARVNASEASSFYVKTTTQYTRDRFIDQQLRFSDSEVYTVKNIYPYKHWRITSNNFNIGVNLTAADVPEQQVETLNQLINRIFSANDLPVTVLQADRNHIEFIAPANAKTIEARIKKIFFRDDTLDAGGSELTYTLVDAGNDLVILNEPLQLGRNYTVGQKIGIALLEDDFFEKSVITQDNLDITNPFSIKTFNVKILGEVDSTITWLTPAFLGDIKANYISTLRVVAQTTVPDSRLIYSLESGSLPNGMRLTYAGEIVGKPTQYGTGKYRSIWKNATDYALNDIVRYSGQFYICTVEHRSAGTGNLTDDNGNWSLHDFEKLGLTILDNGDLQLDANTTTIDRLAKFVVKAQDRFGYSAIEQEFSINVVDTDDKLYSNLYIQPLVEPSIRNEFKLFVNDPNIFPTNAIYRPNDPNFGVQQKIKMLAYAGIETKQIDEYVARAAKWHKRRKLRIGEVKTAVAKNPGTNDVVYEVVYLEIVDPQDKNGEVAKFFGGKADPLLTADSISYEAEDDVSEINTGVPSLIVDGRFQDPLVQLEGADAIQIDTRDGVVTQSIDNSDIDTDLRDGTEVNTDISVPDSEPLRRRKYDERNTIKSDSDAIIINDQNDLLYHVSNITNMRENLEQIGESQREYLPLWMRTGQNDNIAELDYVPAVPLAYCKPGESREVFLNVQNALNEGVWDPKKINFDIDRYILDSAVGIDSERYIVFANYKYNA